MNILNRLKQYNLIFFIFMLINFLLIETGVTNSLFIEVPLSKPNEVEWREKSNIRLNNNHIAIKNLKSGDILIVAGKGHENYQEYKSLRFFSDTKCILQNINSKNKKLSNCLKLKIIRIIWKNYH